MNVDLVLAYVSGVAIEFCLVCLLAELIRTRFAKIEDITG